MEATDFSRFMEVPLEVEALVEGPRLRVRDLLALRVGSVIETSRPAGENVDVVAGTSALGVGELTSAHGKAVVRVLRFRGEE
ncbi:MAG TPA: FliM/FliN family flagellar motor C-terminal domain-containing protein [Bryobacteraceae bacterium]|nr:FliM/FliN family flagellar motor C-terminal domain-containing protein [Bryobacteraceae bacterium]